MRPRYTPPSKALPTGPRRAKTHSNTLSSSASAMKCPDSPSRCISRISCDARAVRSGCSGRGRGTRRLEGAPLAPGGQRTRWGGRGASRALVRDAGTTRSPLIQPSCRVSHLHDALHRRVVPVRLDPVHPPPSSVSDGPVGRKARPEGDGGAGAAPTHSKGSWGGEPGGSPDRPRRRHARERPFGVGGTPDPESDPPLPAPAPPLAPRRSSVWRSDLPGSVRLHVAPGH